MNQTLRLLNIREVADVLRCSAKTVHRLVDRGELTATRVGRRLRIDQRDLEAYLARGRSQLSDLTPRVP